MSGGKLDSIGDPRALLEGIFEHAPVAFQIYDASGRSRLVNQAFIDLFGAAPPPEHNVLEDGIEKQKFLELVKRAFGGETVRIPPHWYGSSEGRRVGIEATLFPLREGEKVAWVAICFRDATALLERQHDRDYLAALQESSVEITTVHRDDTAPTVVSPAVKRILGWTPEEFARLGRTLMHPDDRARVDLRDVLGAPGKARTTSYRLRHKDGWWRWMSVTAINLLDHPAIQGIAVHHHDITELKATAEALERSQEKLTAIVDSIGDGLIATDHEGRITRMNPVAEALTGWTLADAAGRDLPEVFRIVDEVTREPVENPAERVLRDGVRVSLANQTVLIARDGTEHPIADSAAPIRNAGETRGVVLVFRDQAVERAGARALAESEARKGAILDASPDAIVSIDAHGRVTEVNAAFEKTFGYERAAAVGKPVAELIVPDALREKHVLGLHRYIATGEAKILGKRVELRARRADGSELPVEVTIVRIQSDGPPAFTGYIRDLTERRQLASELKGRQRAEAALVEVEDQLRQSQKIEALGRIAGGVAHDFNNLLSVILGQSRLMRADLHAEDPMREGLSDIVRAGERAADLTRQLLAFSRRQILQPRTLDLNQTIADISRMLKRLIGEDIELVFISGSELGNVLVDPGQIEQVIMNLAVNARDAMPKGGKLTIETTNTHLDETYAEQHHEVTPGPHVTISMSDTGSGMSAETQARIFEPFFTTKAQGTGLGLSTVFGIVRQSGGTIWVYSEVDKGTTFKIHFPRTDAAMDPAPQKTLAPRGGSETVLLVEDNAEVRNLAARILRRGGYQVLEATSGGDAFLLFEKRAAEIDLVLTDVVMPQMSGSELATRLARIRPVKVVYMSGYTDDAVVRHGVLEEGVAFIQKPFTPESLLAKVRETLDATNA